MERWRKAGGWRYGLAALLPLLVCAGACERPFVEEETPVVEVRSPDLSFVLADAGVTLRVKAESFRRISRVEVNGREMAFDREDELWELDLTLFAGRNRLVFTAFDENGMAGRDTAFAVHLPYGFNRTGPVLPQPRGGHTATLLPDGSLLVTGGAAQANGLAEGDAFLLESGAEQFTHLEAGLNAPRTGHTATLLPDGRVLILGGSRTEALQAVGDLVEAVEVYDPQTRRFEVMPFEGQPIRRAFHTASVYTTPSGTFVDLYGGRGDIRYDPDNPVLGTRRDLRTLQYEEERVVAVNSLGSALMLGFALAGHTQTRLTSPGAPEPTYLVAGSYFGGTTRENISFLLDYEAPLNPFRLGVPQLRVPRTRHAAAPLDVGQVLFFGGRQADASDVVGETELYDAQANRFFLLPPGNVALRRWGHTATKLGGLRILLLGGFGPSGNSLTAAEYFGSDLLR